MQLIDNFKLTDEREKFITVQSDVINGVDFKGTNLWILIFAILIASLGLNINSTAVIIGAMLISPLMGPIIGVGFGMAINDLSLLKKAFFSYLFAGAIGLITSTLFFLISPLNDAQSELLARTAPTIYDVLIAFFGGLAGILAISSKLKGNVIPGVAIATALMPPLCTAGYGLATQQFAFFFGALYLYLINSVIIALATLITARFLKFPFKSLPLKSDEIKAKRIVWAITLITILPSIYFGYDMIQQNKFEKEALLFIDQEANFSNNYLLKKQLNAKDHEITLTYGGQNIEPKEISALKLKLKKYGLKDVQLNIQQGFVYMNKTDESENVLQFSKAMEMKDEQIRLLNQQVDSANTVYHMSKQLYKELKTINSNIATFTLQKSTVQSDSIENRIWLAVVHTKRPIHLSEQQQLRSFLEIRLNTTNMELLFN